MSQREPKYYRTTSDRTAADDKHCLKCFYHGLCDSIVCCEFILVTGRRRGCPGGVGCARFLPGDPRRRWGIDFELPPGMIPGEPMKEQEAPETFQGKPVRQRRSKLVPMNRKIFKALLDDHTYREMAEDTGYAAPTLKLAMQRGLISLGLAGAIIEAYGVDVTTERS